MKFIPQHARQILFCICQTSAFVFTDESIKETLEWFGASMALGRIVLRRNFEGKLGSSEKSRLEEGM